MSTEAAPNKDVSRSFASFGSPDFGRRIAPHKDRVCPTHTRAPSSTASSMRMLSTRASLSEFVAN